MKKRISKCGYLNSKNLSPWWCFVFFKTMSEKNNIAEKIKKPTKEEENQQKRTKK